MKWVRKVALWVIISEKNITMLRSLFLDEIYGGKNAWIKVKREERYFLDKEMLENGNLENFE